MTQPLARRDFLRGSATATAILGFPFLAQAAADQVKKSPDVDFLALARERMQREKRPGVILVIPQDAKAAEALADSLARLLGISGLACLQDQPVSGKMNLPPIGSGDPKAHVLFCQAVFVCLPAAQVPLPISEVRPDTAAILLDPDGRPVDAMRAEPELFGKEFVTKMGRFLHGARGERQAAAVKAQREALGRGLCGQLDAALRDLDADEFIRREAASRLLGKVAPRCPAPLAVALESCRSLEVRKRLEAIFEDLYAAAAHGEHGPRLPYGVAWEGRQVDPCPFCGLSSAPHPTRLFLRFLADQEKK